mmetsp:Transcript_16596/g.38125  ORF Transcript_16596/g.38125 Transcript_16596/m.38125 type:complete len:96 (+) Transcript_16596:1839-2126(+)
MLVILCSQRFALEGFLQTFVDRLVHWIVLGISSKSDLVQPLSTPRVKATIFNEIRTRTVGLDGPEGQDCSDPALDSSASIALVAVWAFDRGRRRR